MRRHIDCRRRKIDDISDANPKVRLAWIVVDERKYMPIKKMQNVQIRNAQVRRCVSESYERHRYFRERNILY